MPARKRVTKVASRKAVKKAAKKVARKTTKTAGKSFAKKSVKKTDVAGATSDMLSGPPKAFPPGLSNPAKRALNNIGVTRLSELTGHREVDLANLHGMGPTGIVALKLALKAAGKSFRS